MNKETGIIQSDRKSVSIVENIYSIIDSKIQYLDYQTKELFRPLAGKNEEQDPKSTSSNGLNDLKSKEQWFLAFEKYSKVKRLLLLLRNYLNKENALLVLSLLADHQLIKYSQKDLEYTLGVKQRPKAA